jgi:SAM-dependent methyltransferase
MLESFRANFPDIPSLEGSSYKLPVENDSQEAVIAAQAFHWFADVTSLKEIARVLKPGGKLGLIWNFENAKTDELPSDYWKNAVFDYMNELSGNNPQYAKMGWRKVFEEEQPYFKTPIGEHIVKYERSMPIDRELLWARLKSISFITALSPERQEEVHAEIIRRFDNGLLPEEKASNEVKLHSGVHLVWVEVNK